MYPSVHINYKLKIKFIKHIYRTVIAFRVEQQQQPKPSSAALENI